MGGKCFRPSRFADYDGVWIWKYLKFGSRRTWAPSLDIDVLPAMYFQVIYAREYGMNGTEVHVVPPRDELSVLGCVHEV